MSFKGGLPTYADLRAMTDVQLIKAFDARTGNKVEADFIRQEIALRDQERHTAAMLEHTITRKRLTWAIAAMTLVHLVLFVLR